MFDANRLLGSMINGGLRGSRPSGGFGLGGLGAAGLVGGLAIAAFQHFSEKRGQQQTAPPTPSTGYAPPPPPPIVGAPQPPVSLGPSVPPPPPATPTTAPPPTAMGIDPDTAILLISAMIAAAKADGTIDQQEMRGILDRLEQAGAGPDERAFVMTEIAEPLDIEALVAKVTDRSLAPDVYAASLMAIEVDTPEEEAYLAALAQKLGLEATIVAQLHERLGAPPPPAG